MAVKLHGFFVDDSDPWRSFFLGNFETDGDFELSKLKITIDSDIEAGKWSFGSIVSGVFYDGEEVDNYGGDTSGKSFDAYKNF